MEEIIIIDKEIMITLEDLLQEKEHLVVVLKEEEENSLL